MASYAVMIWSMVSSGSPSAPDARRRVSRVALEGFSSRRRQVLRPMPAARAAWVVDQPIASRYPRIAPPGSLSWRGRLLTVISVGIFREYL